MWYIRVVKEVVASSDFNPDGVEAWTETRYSEAGCRSSKSKDVSEFKENNLKNINIKNHTSTVCYSHYITYTPMTRSSKVSFPVPYNTI